MSVEHGIYYFDKICRKEEQKKYDNSTNNRNEKLIFPRKITDTHTVSQFQIYTIAFCISTCFSKNTWIHNHC